ncbi:MAG: class I SAM-dependent DNA methyltransferase [Patescibacteria group bacterium]|nr:class I SAM-dependent DNA methyltransferase [Patescibacteria group bacterium]
MNNFQSKVSLIWNIAELLRGSWKRHEYQDVILPLTVLKRLDAVLAISKEKVLSNYNQHHGKIDTDPILKDITKVGFYNVSPYDFEKLLDDQKDIAKNLRSYINSFSVNVQQIIEKFDFDKHLTRLEGGNLLYLIIKEFNKIDLHPDTVSNNEMGYIFEELIRKFSEQSNETAGEHYTPREVIQLMVEVMFTMDKPLLKKEHLIKTIYDPCCGTGGMLAVSKKFILENINDKIDIFLYGQELNPVTYAICKADMLIKSEDADKIKGGEKDNNKASTLSNDQFYDKKFDYVLCNPPYGVDWKKDEEVIRLEASRGYAGRFGAGTPRTSDGQLLFLQHMISKMRNTTDGGTRIAVIFNGSPLFTGDAGSGESEIRRWILENDSLEAIVALPDQLFYNTGISTYVWFLTNRKPKERQGKAQLIDARTFFKKMRKSLGNKRHEIVEEDRQRIARLYLDFKESKYSKIFKTTDFAFRQITVERPLRLNFQVNEERLARRDFGGSCLNSEENPAEYDLRSAKEDQRISKILEAIKSIGDKLYKNRDEFLRDFHNALKRSGIQIVKGQLDSECHILATEQKMIIKALSEQDEEADICIDSKGNPESDSELRDTENVPYDQDVYEYFEKEVKPYVPDAWIDESKRDHKDNKVGKVGYEIPVTRYFYEYTPPRALEDIERDIEKVENELLTFLKKL